MNVIKLPVTVQKHPRGVIVNGMEYCSLLMLDGYTGYVHLY